MISTTDVCRVTCFQFSRPCCCVAKNLEIYSEAAAVSIRGMVSLALNVVLSVCGEGGGLFFSLSLPDFFDSGG